MFSGFLRLAFAGLIALQLAACTTGGDTPAPRAQASARSLAFEPIIGIPQERAAVLAEELGARAVERNLSIVARDSNAVGFRVKGYFTAAKAGSETSITYVWDVFDTSGSRVHRLDGTETVAAALPDPWQAVTDDALRRIARRTVADLATWLQSGAPRMADAAPRQGASSTQLAGTRTGITGASALVASTRAIPADDAANRMVGGTPPGATARFGFYVPPVAGAVSDGPALLSTALARELAAAGGAPLTAQDADYVVSAEATVGPVYEGEQTVAIIWAVKDSDGRTLGTVRQVNRVPANALDKTWGSTADHAATAAAPGVISLINGQ